MASLELVVAIGLAVLVGTAAAHRVHVPPPAVLLVVGILLGLVPVLRETHLPPEAVQLLLRQDEVKLSGPGSGAARVVPLTARGVNRER